MGKYSFDSIPDRRNTFSYKWDVGEGTLPMWVADMDFEVAPAVKEAIVKRAEHGVFGYTYAPDEYFESIRDFYERRHGYRFDTKDMMYSVGVVGAISSIVRKLTTPAEKVLIQPPVYNIFYNSIYNNGRYIEANELKYDGEEYSVDFEDLEKKLSDPQVTLFILCNPHNPVGKIYTKEELIRVGELCKKYSVTVVSDEIHSEFTFPKKSYVPFASASETCRDISVTLVSSSKSFNIAGLYGACAIAHDPLLRQRVYRALNTDEIGEPNAFAVAANIAAFTECDEWLDELIDYIEENKRLAREYINESIPGLHAPKSFATYLLWVDASELGVDSVQLCEFLKERVGLKLSDGLEYGESGRYFIRINLATSRENVRRGMELLKNGVELILEEKGKK